jgi:hypothetical protein
MIGTGCPLGACAYVLLEGCPAGAVRRLASSPVDGLGVAVMSVIVKLNTYSSFLPGADSNRFMIAMMRLEAWSVNMSRLDDALRL